MVKKKIEIFNEDNCIKVFIDITFKITPTKFRQYKLLVIAGITKYDNIPKILSFIILKHLENECYDRILNISLEFSIHP